MKRLTFTLLLVLAVTVVGCGGGKKGGKIDGTNKANDTTRLTESASNESNPTSESGVTDDTRLAEFDEDDPFSELIVQYTPAQLKKIIGKAEPEDVTDLFLLLPDTDFLLYFNFTAEQRKEMLKGETIQYVELSDIDVKNGYISSGYEGTWEMFAKKIDGVWWIALYENNCGEYCSTVQAKTYTYGEGKLVQRNHANLAGYQDVWVELFVDFDQLTEEQRELANGIWEAQQEAERDSWEENNGVNSGLLFRLPRDGKNITMYVEAYPYTEAGIPESAIREVTTAIWE
ncbi:MAG: hypothetical protein ACOX19_05260 [Fermentimonas sp.]